MHRWQDGPRSSPITRKRSKNGSDPQISLDHPDELIGRALLMEAFASADDDFVNGIVSQLANVGGRGQDINERGLNFMLSVIKGTEPRNQLEAMLAAQMAAVHMASMTFAGRLAHVDDMPQQDSAERAFNKLTRTFATQMEALNRYRTGGEQKVTVQHVSVAEGGQAIVGNVTQAQRENGLEKRRHHRRSPSPIRTSFPCQPLTKARNAPSLQGGANQPNDRRSQTQHGADACQPSLRRQDSHGQVLQVTISPRQEALPHAWGCVGIRRSARQQERAEARPLYARGHRGTPATAGADAAIAHADSNIE